MAARRRPIASSYFFASYFRCANSRRTVDILRVLFDHLQKKLLGLGQSTLLMMLDRQLKFKRQRSVTFLFHDRIRCESRSRWCGQLPEAFPNIFLPITLVIADSLVVEGPVVVPVLQTCFGTSDGSLWTL